MLTSDARVSQATTYRYLHEGIDVIVAHGQDLPEVLAYRFAQGWSLVCLDSTLVAGTRSSERSRTATTCGTWASTNATADNIQVVTDPSGPRVWVSEVEPGSTHDITAAGEHCLGALYQAAAAGLPTLTDKEYVGAGIGIQVPTKGRNNSTDNQTRNLMINATRAATERANALRKRTWTTLERVTLFPWRIGANTSAALVLLHLQRSSR